ncbi:MAG: hypothetical protein IPF77_02090 [Gemmatimonadetes bacterium]|nr:hypothetical protein [Gemmatimonadota bacterium]
MESLRPRWLPRAGQPPLPPTSRRRWLGRLATRLLLPALLGTLLLGLGGCDESTGPAEPPYIAIVPVITAEPGTDVGREYTYRITEISGTLHIDEIRRVAPGDTVIVPVRPATYRVTLSGLPSQCQVQDGAEIYLLVPENSNTALWRFLISCESLIRVTTATDGYQNDATYAWTISQAGGTVRSGVLGANDTLHIDDLPSGEYDVDLLHVSGNCTIISDGSRRQHFTVTGKGGAKADYRVVCSDPAQRPEFLSVATSYHDGVSGFMFRVADPDGDAERYFWDITDCHGTSVITTGGRQRRGLLTGAPFGPDTATIFGAIELGLPDTDLQGRCTSLRVQDWNGNTTAIVEEPIGNEAGAGPQPAAFNAKLSTTAALTTVLQVTEPDYAGFFGAATLRDGILFTPDGRPDVGVFNAFGFEGDVLVPTIPLGGGRPQYYDYYSVILYLFDQNGNFTRIEDNDLFQ